MTYTEILSSFNLSTIQWVTVFFAGIILGMGKSGIKGIDILIVLTLAFVFGEKASTGVLLPMLISADILAVIYYNRHAKWKFIFKLLPWMLAGILIGVWIGNDISEIAFKKMMSVIIIGSVLIMAYFEKRKSMKVPKQLWFSSSMGLLAGFTTMIGNLAGAVANIYFLAMRFPKNEFIGTVAWLFFIVNLFKLPFHLFVWETVTKETLVLNSVLLPAVIIGFIVGVTLVKKISDTNYRKFILIVTAIGAIVMLIR